jgi:LysM repeat protein
VTTPSPAGAYTIQSGETLSSIAGQFGTTVSALLTANPQITNPDLIFAGTLLTIPGSGLIPITGQQARLTLAPTSGGPSTLVTISGSDFAANASLSVTAGPQGSTPTVSLSVTTDGNGGFTTQLVIPPATPGGSVWLITAASSASGGPSAPAEFQVTTAAPTGLYTIQAGDTLVSLAARFGTTLFGLMRANPNLTDPNQLAAGQQIYIPGSTAVVNGQRIYIVKSGDTLGGIAVTQNVTLAVLEQANPQITNPGLIFAGDHVILP